MNLAPVLKQRFFDANGLPLAGGQLFSYVAGTTTPQATYSNAGGTTNTNPVVLDAQGYADVWIDPTLAYKFMLQDSGSNTIWTEDNVTAAPLGIAWNPNTVYSQGAIVQDASGQGLLYVSLIVNNQNQPLTTVGAWRVFSGNVRALSVNTTLAVTDDLVRSNSTSGALTHTLPSCATTPIGKRIMIKDVGTGGNTTSVKGSGTDNVDGANTYSTALRNKDSATFANNGTSWDVVQFSLPDGSVSTAKLADGSVTQAKLAPRSAGIGTQPAGGVAVSSTSGSYFSNSVSFVAVTNLQVALTTTGRPVMVMLQSDGTSSPAYLGATITGGTSGTGAQFEIVRDSLEVGLTSLDPGTSASTTAIQVPPGSLSAIDYTVAAGSHTYTVQVSAAVTGTTAYVYNSRLVAYEI